MLKLCGSLAIRVIFQFLETHKLKEVASINQVTRHHFFVVAGGKLVDVKYRTCPKNINAFCPMVIFCLEISKSPHDISPFRKRSVALSKIISIFTL